MCFKIREGESPTEFVRRVAAEQLGAGRAGLAAVRSGNAEAPAAVHDLRKRCKKVRALLRLVRPGLGRRGREAGPRIRDLARELAATRDAAARLEALDELARHAGERGDEVGHEAVVAVRRATRQDEQIARAPAELLMRVDGRLAELLEDATRWRVRKRGFEAIELGAARMQRRARQALDRFAERARPRRAHMLRKCAKDAWYARRLLRPLWPEVMGAEAVALRDLTELLGSAQDLVLIGQMLRNAPPPGLDDDELLDASAAARARRDELWAAALPLARRSFVERPSACQDRVRALFAVWLDQTSS